MEINIYFLTLTAPAVTVMCVEFVLFSVAGPLPSPLIFLFTQLYGMAVTLFIGVLNVSALLQVAIIKNWG